MARDKHFLRGMKMKHYNYLFHVTSGQWSLFGDFFIA